MWSKALENIPVRWAVIILLLVSLMCDAAAQSGAASQRTTTTLPPKTIQRIEAIIQAEMQRLDIPDLSIAIAVENRFSYANGFGLADLENNVPAKADSVYRTASVAKPITGTAVMQMVEQGKLSLDAPVQKYCPAFPAKKWPVTIRQLLAHQGGIRHTRGAEDLSTEHFFNLNDALRLFKDDPLEYEPGTKYRYTTLGYTLLGCAIEGAAGMSFADYLREYILRPAEMTNTGVDDWFAIIPGRARGYVKLDEKNHDRCCGFIRPKESSSP